MPVAYFHRGGEKELPQLAEAGILSKNRRGVDNKWTLCLTEANLTVGAEPHGYTFWDYQAGAWQRNHGIRIDHVLLSPQATDRLQACEIHRNVRAGEKPSDHVPVVATLAD